MSMATEMVFGNVGSGTFFLNGKEIERKSGDVDYTTESDCYIYNVAISNSAVYQCLIDGVDFAYSDSSTNSKITIANGFVKKGTRIQCKGMLMIVKW